MFNYATYNGVPIITYVLIGLTTSILGLVTLNPGMLELKEDGTQTTISEAIGLDKISMPQLPSYVPGLNGMPQPFSGDENDEEEEDEEEGEEEDEDNDDDEQSSVFNPLRQSGGKKTRSKRKIKRKTKRKK